jgi:protein SDA1
MPERSHSPQTFLFPQAYLDELLLQLRHFDAAVLIFNSRPSKPAPELAALATFLAHVTPCYPQHLRDFPGKLVGLLELHSMVMDGVLRKGLAENIIMLRNRKLLPVVSVNQLFFQMFRYGS